jgi:hypothetical protein
MTSIQLTFFYAFCNKKVLVTVAVLKCDISHRNSEILERKISILKINFEAKHHQARRDAFSS